VSCTSSHLWVSFIIIACIVRTQLTLIEFTSAILYSLKAMDPIDSDDAYAVVKSLEDGELIEQCTKVLEEEERLWDKGSTWDDSSLCSNSENDISDFNFQGPGIHGDGSCSKESSCINPVQKVLYILLLS
jgi:hypothetical protein